jgi:hypothetical protein
MDEQIFTITLITDRHDCAIGVVVLIPTFQGRGTKIGALASESVTTPGHVPNLQQDFPPHTFFRTRRATHAKHAGVRLFRAD